MSKLFDAAIETDNVTVTEKGMTAYKSTLSKVLDLFQDGFSYRRNPESVSQLIREAALEDKNLTLRCLFYIRDIHEGQGEREVFRSGMRTFLSLYPEASHVLNLIATGEKQYGRWDDLVALIGISDKIDKEIFTIIANQLNRDQINVANENFEKVSLLAKWLPSCNTSSAKTRALGAKVWRGIGFKDERTYRLILSGLRKAINIVESKISTKDYSFDYSKLPSLAINKYKKAFLRHDSERYIKYNNDLNNVLRDVVLDSVPNVKINTATLYPYDVVRPILRNMEWNYSSGAYTYTYKGEETFALQADSQWRSLKNYFEGAAGNHNWLAVVDTSGSMFDSHGPHVASIEVAASLGLYIAEHNNGIFKNQFITFDSTPKFMTVDDKWSLVEKLNYIASAPWGGTTNIEKVFDLVLNAAVKHKISEEEMPESIVIISDMQFDEATTNSDALQMIRHKYEAAGYKCPKLVFWNACARYATSKPVTRGKSGVILVGGCKPGLFEQILASKSPEDFMLDVLNSPRYSVINA